MERECTPACVAYTASNDLIECVKHGMNDMHCMRLLLDLVDTMGMTGCNESEEAIF
jgi:hypothetical protein